MIRSWFPAVLAVIGCAAPDPHHKPSAPIEVTLAAREVGGGEYELVLTATPTRSVTDLVLALDGITRNVGPAAAGQAQVWRSRQRVGSGTGRDIVGAALVGTGNHRRSRAAVVHVGALAPRAARATQVVRLPGGIEVEEVRR